MNYPVPPNEADRLKALRKLAILDTPPEERFDRITRLACRVLDVPICTIALIDESRQWFKSAQGLDVRETSREISFCGYAVADNSSLVVADASRDPRFGCFPNVVGAPHIRFYASELLKDAAGYNLGTLCVVDTKPRQLSEENRRSLVDLAAMARDEVLGSTERELSELLKRSEERFNLFVTCSDAGFFDAEVAEGKVYYSPRWKEMLGYANHELPDTDATWVSRVHPDDFGTKFERAFAVRPGTNPFNVEYRMRHRDGTWRWIQSQGVEIVDPQTLRRVRTLGFQTDITQRRRLEERMRLLELTVDNISDGVLVCEITPVGRLEVVYANRALLEMTGYGLSELLGQSPSILHGPHADPEAVAELMAYVRRGEIFNCELLNTRKDGSPLPVELNVTPLKNEGGVITHWVSVRRDITQRRQAEAALTEAKERAESANQAKSQFLANMSHEVRTPLNGIIGVAELLAATTLTAEQRDLLETIQASSDNLLTIINDILDFSKIEFGKLELDFHEFLLSDIADDVVGLLSYRATRKGLEFIAVIDPSLSFRVVGDSGRLRQVLLNLVSNAIKFTEAGEVVLEMSQDNAKFAPSGQIQIRFSVRDSGIGIPAERRDRLFKSFSQVDASTTRKYGGTGLGLAICQKLVELMGGTIEVHSVADQGSTFSFSLSLPLGQDVSLQSPPTGLAGARILVVDDNETNRKMLSAHLAAWSAICTCARTGFEALALLKTGERAFDVGVIDMQMPGMDGIEFAQRLKSELPEVRFPLLLCTSLGAPVDQASLKALGYAACLSKPLRSTTLGEALGGLLGAHPLTRPRSGEASPTLLAPKVYSHIRVLLVEDNLVNQKVGMALLAQMGVRADVCANGRLAVEAVTTKQYDLVLMDVHMPELDGLEATRQIRARVPAECQPRIVALTADALTGDKERCLAAGMDGYVTKPIKMADVRGILQDMLS